MNACLQMLAIDVLHYIKCPLELMSPLSLHESSDRFIEALLPWNGYLIPNLSQSSLRTDKCQLFAIKFMRISIYAQYSQRVFKG
ncbi:MAG: hypothetical protein M1G31_26170 [Pseudanabaena sp. Salubria-1]|nr:hypothetical protein [Pseudanabaena sp. Salubria-1]